MCRSSHPRTPVDGSPASFEIDFRSTPTLRALSFRKQACRQALIKTKPPGHAHQGARIHKGPDDDLLSRGIPRTIIGATAFHGPVRNGKAWCHSAMFVRNSVAGQCRSRDLPGLLRPTYSGRSIGVNDCNQGLRGILEPQAQGYRIKPHGQLVPVSLRRYRPSTPGLSTRWSSATL